MMMLAADDAAAALLATVRRSSAAFHMPNDVARMAVASNKAKPANSQLGLQANAAARHLAGVSARGAGARNGPAFTDVITRAGELRSTARTERGARGRLRSPGSGRRVRLRLLDEVKVDHLPGRVGIGHPTQIEA